MLIYDINRIKQISKTIESITESRINISGINELETAFKTDSNGERHIIMHLDLIIEERCYLKLLQQALNKPEKGDE